MKKKSPIYEAVLMDRKLNSNLKILRTYHDIYHGYNKVREFQFGDKVWIRNYGKGNKWIQCVLLAKTDSISYKISYDEGEAKEIYR